MKVAISTTATLLPVEVQRRIERDNHAAGADNIEHCGLENFEASGP